MYRTGELQQMVPKLHRALELVIPEDKQKDIDAKLIQEFTQKAKSTYDEITDLIHKVEDWVHEKCEQLEKDCPAELLEMKVEEE